MIRVKNQITRKRPKSPYIQLIQEIAPWVLISKAAEESGLTELQIRNSGARSGNSVTRTTSTLGNSTAGSSTGERRKPSHETQQSRR